MAFAAIGGQAKLTSRLHSGIGPGQFKYGVVLL